MTLSLRSVRLPYRKAKLRLETSELHRPRSHPRIGHRDAPPIRLPLDPAHYRFLCIVVAARRLTLLFGVAGSLVLQGAQRSEPSAWDLALGFDYQNAVTAFAEAHANAPEDPALTIGFASTLLVKPGRTQSDVIEAHRLLEALSVRLDSGYESLPLSLYLLARIEHDHLEPARLPSARERYEALLQTHPGHPQADQAAVNLALLALDLPAAEAASRLERLLTQTKGAPARRELHFLLAALHLRSLDDLASALSHLRAGRALGYETPLRNAEIDLSIANLAWELGDLALARKHYTEFVAAMPRDVRVDTLRRRLRDLDNPSKEIPRP